MSINNFYPQIPSDQQQQLWWQQMGPSPAIPNACSSSNSSSPSPSPSNWLSVAHNQNPPHSSSSAALNFNLNHHHDNDDSPQRRAEEGAVIDKEGMFEKPLTPSDVGKLNRLVIPKQHAERYFPLQGADSVEKGLLLSFEDELGKCWRFRYSYWNSSQSYVLTKGWSRYVKEKQLDAGDVVLFERHRGDADRLFIGWRRRGSTAVNNNAHNNNIIINSDHHQQQQHYHNQGVGGGGGGWGRGGVVGGSTAAQPYLDYGGGGYQHSEYLHAPGGEKETNRAAGGNSKRLRLFGVNMEWQPENEESSSSPSAAEAAAASFTPDLHLFHDPTSSLHRYYSQPPYQNNSPSSSSSGPNHMVMRYT